jgi:arrestin-related trafficking adapter 1
MPRLPFSRPSSSTTVSTPNSPLSSRRSSRDGTTPPGSPAIERRLSFGMERLSFSKEKRRSLVEKGRPTTPKSAPAVSHGAKVEIVVESPPLIFYGSVVGSTGALLSGQIKVAVTEPEITVDSIRMQLLSKTYFGKPVAKDCSDCAAKTDEVYLWKFLGEPKKLVRGTHSFPFSYLLPGSLPASTHSRLVTIEYSLAVVASTPKDHIRSSHPIEVKRALPEPQMNRTSERIFPPTNLKTQLEHAPVMYPIGEQLCLFRINGISHQDKQAKFRWRLRRITWTLNEQSTVMSPACPKHTNKVHSDKPGIEHSETRAVGYEELKGGWKTDYDPATASTDLEFKLAFNPSRQPTCDVHTQGGNIKITHQLVIEIIISEEVSQLKNENWSATGSARVLRSQHAIVLSERTGMGISWDEEQPPMYEDVPESPPYYQTAVSDYVGEIPEDDNWDLPPPAN